MSSILRLIWTQQGLKPGQCDVMSRLICLCMARSKIKQKRTSVLYAIRMITLRILGTKQHAYYYHDLKQWLFRWWSGYNASRHVQICRRWTVFTYTCYERVHSLFLFCGQYECKWIVQQMNPLFCQIQIYFDTDIQRDTAMLYNLSVNQNCYFNVQNNTNNQYTNNRNLLQ
jgi:hypothetical protein